MKRQNNGGKKPPPNKKHRMPSGAGTAGPGEGTSSGVSQSPGDVPVSGEGTFTFW